MSVSRANYEGGGGLRVTTQYNVIRIIYQARPLLLLSFVGNTMKLHKMQQMSNSPIIVWFHYSVSGERERKNRLIDKQFSSAFIKFNGHLGYFIATNIFGHDALKWASYWAISFNFLLSFSLQLSSTTAT